MKQFYKFSKTLMLAGALFGYGNLSAQNETIATIPSCPNLTQDFTNGNGAFTSPGIYGGSIFDSAFYYNNARGLWTELGSTLPGRTTPPGTGIVPGVGRVIQIISPAYPSTNPTGIYDVGFHYIVPVAAVDRFKVTLIRLTTTPSSGGDVTVAEVVAETGFLSFAAFSSGPITPYVDPIPQNVALHTGEEGNVCIRLNDIDITTGPNITYRVQFSYIIYEPRFSDFDDFRINLTDPAPLPVSFMGIVANRVDNGISVRWDVADEIDLEQYLVEKSTNGYSFSTVGSVAPNGRRMYSFTDPNNKGNVIYYRVKSVDLNGSTKYSSIVKINGENSFSSVIKAYPSPARSSVTLQHSRLEASAKVTITTADGRVVKVLTPSNGVSNTMIDVSNLTTGMYFIKLDKGNGKVETTSFVKQ